VTIIQLFAIIGLGLLSRMVHTGWIVIDKYAGDALYAAMVYTLLSLFTGTRPSQKALFAMGIMTALEVFQLTMIPAELVHSPNLWIRIVGRLLGTEFSFLDLAAYAVGIGVAFQTDKKFS